jgi:hypothetical protein
MHLRLRSLKGDHDWNQMQIQELFYITQRAYSPDEKGDISPPIRMFVNPAKLYHAGMDCMVGWIDDPRPCFCSKAESKQFSIESISS